MMLNDDSFVFSVFRQNTGEYVKTIESTDLESVILNFDHEQEVIIIGEYTESHCLVDGFIEDCGPKPVPDAVFDADQQKWVNPRTAAEIKEERNNIRRTFRIQKATFLREFMARGYLIPIEAAHASRGDIPQFLVPVLKTLGPEDLDIFHIDWPSAAPIGRLDPMIVSLGQHYSISAQELDLIFGVPGEAIGATE